MQNIAYSLSCVRTHNTRYRIHSRYDCLGSKRIIQNITYLATKTILDSVLTVQDTAYTELIVGSLGFGWLDACLTSQQHAIKPQGRVWRKIVMPQHWDTSCRSIWLRSLYPSLPPKQQQQQNNNDKVKQSKTKQNKINQTKPNQTKPNQTKPNQTKQTNKQTNKKLRLYMSKTIYLNICMVTISLKCAVWYRFDDLQLM